MLQACIICLVGVTWSLWREQLRCPCCLLLNEGLYALQVMQGYHGLRANATMPPADKLASFTRLELDFELGCPGACMASALCLGDVFIFAELSQHGQCAQSSLHGHLCYSCNGSLDQHIFNAAIFVLQPHEPALMLAHELDLLACIKGPADW